MPRVLVLMLALMFALGGLLGVAPAPVHAQVQADARLQGDEEDAAEAAEELSRLEADGKYNALYDLMHPDARDAVPEAAVVGWYEQEFVGKRTDELTVTGVRFLSWTWDVTGETYRRTASVSFVQPYWEDGVRADVPGTVHLVESAEGWGWFFGGSRAFVDSQIALYGTGSEPARVVVEEVPSGIGGAEGDFVSAFPEELDRDVDLFWAGEFAEAGIAYNPPDDIVEMDGPIVTACGPAAPAETAAFYCTLDETIYYNPEFRLVVEQNVGDFAWVTVIAHEWGHHVQAQLGIYATENPELDGGLYTVELEQQADCLAGVYTADAEDRGWLDAGDYEEAIYLTGAAGDPEGTAADDPEAHGTSQQRRAAFRSGYTEGLAGCDLDL